MAGDGSKWDGKGDGSKRDGKGLSMSPVQIELASMATIRRELGTRAQAFSPGELAVVERVIHTTADFSFADNLAFSPGAIEAGLAALRNHATILTDTNMARSGVSKASANALGCEVVCYMAEPDVAAAAKAGLTTRAVASMDRACRIEGPLVIAVGNAPTALLRIVELVKDGRLHPDLVVGVPVGFVNVVEAKEELLASGIPAIVARGRRGGSAVAAAIMNALLYQLDRPGWKGEPGASGFEMTAAPAPSLAEPARQRLADFTGALERGDARVAVFAGTTEGREVSRILADRGVAVREFVATEWGAQTAGNHPGVEVRSGRLDADGMRAALAGCTCVVDATHPYARRISQTVRDVCGVLGLPFVRLARPATPLPPDAVTVVDAAQAAAYLASRTGNILLATGAKELTDFVRVLRESAADQGTPESTGPMSHVNGMRPADSVNPVDRSDPAGRIWLRALPTESVIAKARELGIPGSHLVLMQGPFSHEMNVATLHLAQARWLVTKDSGVQGGMPDKLSACAECGAVPVVLARPPEPADAVDPGRLLELLRESGR